LRFARMYSPIHCISGGDKQLLVEPVPRTIFQQHVDVLDLGDGRENFERDSAGEEGFEDVDTLVLE
jgi:hypothetical protein